MPLPGQYMEMWDRMVLEPERRKASLAALREVREMVADRREASRIAWINCEGSPDFQRSFGDYVREDDEVLKQIDALIKREEEGR